jgi:ParB family chromosome partitioning protein
MAKRKRLTPSLLMSGFDPDTLESPSLSPQGNKVFLRSGLSGGAVPPIARVAAESSAEAALAEVTHAMAEARSEGRIVQSLPLSAIDMQHLVRDRLDLDEEALGHLMASIREHGQRSPIEVTDIGDGRYGLISGWRRMQALHRLSAEASGPEFGLVLALLRRPSDASEAYIAMVEENEVRQGLSYYERARIAARSVDMGVFKSEKQALQRLFSAASRARRSKIGSFMTLYRLLDEGLRFPATIPERLGLAVAKALGDGAADVAGLLADLCQSPSTHAADEQARLLQFVAVTARAGRPNKAAPARYEVVPGIFLEVMERALAPVFMLSGPAISHDFRKELERWLADR